MAAEVGAPSDAGADVASRRRGDLVGTLVMAVGVTGFVAVLVLAAPLGALLQPAPLDFWPEPALRVTPEPTELSRFAIAITVPLVIAALLHFGRDRNRQIPGPISIGRAATVGAVVGLGLIVVGWVAGAERPAGSRFLPPPYFGPRDLAGAVLVAAAITVVGLNARARVRITRILARPWPSHLPRWPVRVALIGVVIAATALYVAPAVYMGDNLGDAPNFTSGHLEYTLADFAAFANGATPLADFASQYSNLLPWGLHPVLSALDYTPGSFTLVMALLSAVALLALWRALALAVGNEWVGAALYLPVLALSVRPTLERGDERTSNASLAQILPERYLLPCVVAWLCVRHVRGRRPHAPATLFFVATLAFLNNPEFGGPCLLAALGAMLIGGDEPRQIRRLSAHLVGGAVAATALVSVITMARGGSVPDPALFTYYSRLFAAQGFALLPMPVLGFHLVLYVTFAGAVILAASRRPVDRSEVPLSALLAFGGIFGLGASTYYIGRSNVVTLTALFPVWALCVALLAWTSFTWLLSLPDRRQLATPIGGLALCALVGLGLAGTDLLDAPGPLTQVGRLTDAGGDPSSFFELEADEEFVALRTNPGESVLVLRGNGHLIARGAGVRNVSVIGHPFHLVSAGQLDDLLADLRGSGGRAVFVGNTPYSFEWGRINDELRARGWLPVANDPDGGMVEWRLVSS